MLSVKIIRAHILFTSLKSQGNVKIVEKTTYRYHFRENYVIKLCV